jgi:epsilon-lactone hydrolase
MLHVPARDVPVPTGVSPEAKAQLMAPRREFPGYPPVDDIAGWRRYAAIVNQAMTGPMQARAAAVDAEVTDHAVAGVKVYEVRPRRLPSNDPRILLDIHGGAYIVGFGDACRAQAIGVADDYAINTFSVDYRSPPDHPYPAPLDDCLAVYRVLVERHGAGNIVIGGASAGANLTAALLLRAHDEGLPMPAGAILHTPHLDMTNGSDSLYANRGLDAVLSGSDLTSISAVYAPGQDYRHPYLSPLFGDLRHFPPTFLSTGTRDLFLSDTVRMHAALRALDIPAELHVTEAASHGNFHGAPEERHINREVRKFLTAVLPGEGTE